MSEKGSGPANQTNARGSETAAGVVSTKKGQSASNLLGALTGKPPAQSSDSGGGGNNNSGGASGGSDTGAADKKS